MCHFFYLQQIHGNQKKVCNDYVIRAKYSASSLEALYLALYSSLYLYSSLEALYSTHKSVVTIGPRTTKFAEYVHTSF